MSHLSQKVELPLQLRHPEYHFTHLYAVSTNVSEIIQEGAQVLIVVRTNPLSQLDQVSTVPLQVAQFVLQTSQEFDVILWMVVPVVQE